MGSEAILKPQTLNTVCLLHPQVKVQTFLITDSAATALTTTFFKQHHFSVSTFDALSLHHLQVNVGFK